MFDDASQPEWSTGGFGWGTYVANAAYTPLGETQLLDVGNTYGTYVSYSYQEATRRLTGIGLRRERGAGSDLDVAYSYDAAGNVTSMVDAPGIGTVDAQCFAYDGLRRLTEAWSQEIAACGDQAPGVGFTPGGPGAYWNSYAFDAIGNRSTVTERDAQGVAGEYVYSYEGAGGPHAVAGVSADLRLVGSQSWEYVYDAAGNTVSRPGPTGGTQELAWDAEGRLASVEAGVKSAEYVYDADGSRVIRTEDRVTTVFLPGGQEASIDALGNVTATRWYDFAGATVALRTDMGLGGVDSVVTDQHGSVIATVDNTAGTVRKTLTDPYGNLRGGDQAPGGRGLMNKHVDSLTGLTQVGARYYDQLLGRFISVDPIMDLTDPQQWHGYAYANNNPTTWNDPTGLILQVPGSPVMKGQKGMDGQQVRQAPNRTPRPTPPPTPPGSSTGSGSSSSIDTTSKPTLRDRLSGTWNATKNAAAKAAAASRDWLQDDRGAKASGILGAVSVATGMLALGLTLTGVGAPAAAILGGISIATGIAAAAIDCAADFLSQACGMGMLGATTGLLGRGVKVLHSANVIDKFSMRNGEIVTGVASAGSGIASSLIGAAQESLGGNPRERMW